MAPGWPFAWGSRLTRSRWPLCSPAWRERRRSAPARGSGSSSAWRPCTWGSGSITSTARSRGGGGPSSLDGVYLDYLMHHLVNLALGFALGYGLARRLGRPGLGHRGVRDRRRLGSAGPAQRLPLQGVLPAAQEHAGTATASRAEAAAGRRPRRPGPGRGLGALTWPALQGLRAARRAARPDRSRGHGARFIPRSGRAAGWPCVAVMAVLAPALGAARIARAVARGSQRGRVRAVVPAVGPPGPRRTRGSPTDLHRTAPWTRRTLDVASPTE